MLRAAARTCANVAANAKKGAGCEKKKVAAPDKEAGCRIQTRDPLCRWFYLFFHFFMDTTR